MKPSFTPVIIPSQKKADGSYNVKIRVTFKRRSKRLSTHIDATKKDLTKDFDFKEGPVRRLAYKIVDEMKEACAEIDYLDLQAMEVEDIIKFIDTKVASKAKFHLDFIEYMHEKAKGKGASERLYVTAANALSRYMNGHPLNVNDISRSSSGKSRRSCPVSVRARRE